MDETLKSLRTVHLTLCVVTAVMILVMITTYQADRYQKSLDELQSLKDLSWDQYAGTALGILEKELSPPTLKKLQMEYGSVFEAHQAGHVKPEVEMKLLPLLPLPALGSRVSDYRNFIAGPNEIGFYEPGDPAGIVPIIVTDFTAKDQNPNKYSPQATLDFVDFQLFTKSHEIATRKLASETEILTRPLLPNQTDSFHQLYYTVPATNIVQQRGVVRKVRLVTIKGYYVRQWLENMHSRLIEDKRSQTVIFPQSVEFSAQIDAMTLEDSIAFLKQRIKDKDQNFSFLGQTFAASIMGLIGPSTVFLLVLVLLVLQRHLSEFIPIQAAEVTAFPWVGLFQDNLSRALFRASVYLPAAATLASLFFLVELGSAIFFYNVVVLLLTGLVCGLLDQENKRILCSILTSKSVAEVHVAETVLVRGAKPADVIGPSA